MNIEYFSCSNRGKVRIENQDKVYQHNPQKSIGSLTSDRICFAVFDGMGGGECGKVASKIAFDCFKETENYDKNFSLVDICFEINRRICRFTKDNFIKNMGTTAAIIRFNKNDAEICNIGDSRIYKITDNEIKQISVDHTVILPNFENKRVLLQNLGIPEEEMIIEPYYSEIDCEKGDSFLLCSDGLTDMISDTEIFEIVKNYENSVAGERLINAALENGGKDNVSIVLVKIK